MPKHLHLTLNLLPAGTHEFAWRSPQSDPLAALDIGHYQTVVRLAERGLFDAVFLADILTAPAPDAEAPLIWGLDPLLALAAIAGATTHIGLIGTSSTTFSHPYSLARSYLSLDHISHGRAGWNAVTSYVDAAARNYGLDALPARHERYAAAGEFIEVVLGLWDSWESGALVADQAGGVFKNPDRVHALEHAGPRYRVSGPMQLPRSPQGRPVVAQSGGSEEGQAMAGRYADIVFCAHHDMANATAYADAVRGHARQAGRNPDDVCIMPGLILSIGSTEAEAWQRKRELDGMASDDSILAVFAERHNVDPADLHLDAPIPLELVPRLTSGRGSVGFAAAGQTLFARRDLTLRQIIDHGSSGHKTLVGTPEQIADHMETWFKAGAADGFTVMNDLYPSGLEAFVDQVVPLLQSRGLYRTEYRGSTLRDHLGIEQPDNGFAAPRP